MEKLDRLGWADGVAFESHGARVGVRVTDPLLLDRVRALLPPGAGPAASPVVDNLYSLVAGGAGDRPGIKRYSVLYDNATRLARTLDLDEALAALESRLHLAVAAHARDGLFVHAGVVVWNGGGIVVPGRTHSGKSTLVDALVRLGATYYSDEYAVLDVDGRVSPYLRPLSLRARGDVPARSVPAAALHTPADAGPVPVSLVVLTSFRDGAEWRPRRVSPGRALLGLLDNTVAARIKPAHALRVLNTVVTRAATVRGPRGEVEATARRLLAYASAQPHRRPRVTERSAAPLAV